MAHDDQWPTPKSWLGVTSRQRDFGRAVLDMAVQYSSSITFTRPNDYAVYQSASGFLFKPGNRTFLVTNAHVLDDGYIPMKAEYADTIFIFGKRVIEPNVIAKNSSFDVDLAILDVEGIEFEKDAQGYWDSAAAKLTTYAPPSWPLTGPKTGESSVIVGWPTKFRTHEGGGNVEFAAFPMLGNRIDVVTEKWFAVPFERGQMISGDFDPANAVVFENALGGMSGSPVFALHRSGIHPLELVGVVARYGGGELDTMFCTRADLIQHDGTIAAPA